MRNKSSAILSIAICAAFLYVLIHSFFIIQTRTVRNDVVQGILFGWGMAFVAVQIYARMKITKVNGWITMFGCNKLGNGYLKQAACYTVFPGPVNVSEEAVYWKARADNRGRTFTGRQPYVMRFPPGGLPPNHAFWSLTISDANNRFVENALNRYCVSDRSGLVPNQDGSLDIYIQKTSPQGLESNWLPAPEGDFVLWLRVYQPDEIILKGGYRVPPVSKVK